MSNVKAGTEIQHHDLMSFTTFTCILIQPFCYAGRWQLVLPPSPLQQQLAQRMPQGWRHHGCHTRASWSTWTWAG